MLNVIHVQSFACAVLHDIDKVTSIFQHLTPAAVAW